MPVRSPRQYSSLFLVQLEFEDNSMACSLHLQSHHGGQSIKCEGLFIRLNQGILECYRVSVCWSQAWGSKQEWPPFRLVEILESRTITENSIAEYYTNTVLMRRRFSAHLAQWDSLASGLTTITTTMMNTTRNPKSPAISRWRKLRRKMKPDITMTPKTIMIRPLPCTRTPV